MGDAVKQPLFAVLAEFKDPADLVRAARRVREEGYTKFDCHTPFPVHGLEKAMGAGESLLGFIVLACGMAGAVGGFAFQSWAAIWGYPLTLSGKPLFSFPAFIPVTFELMVLLSAFGAVFGMLALNKLPMLYHAFFKYSRYHVASTDGFLISIEAADPRFHPTLTSAFLREIGGSSVETVEA